MPSRPDQAADGRVKKPLSCDLRDAREVMLWKLDGLSQGNSAFWKSHGATIERAIKAAASFTAPHGSVGTMP